MRNRTTRVPRSVKRATSAAIALAMLVTGLTVVSETLDAAPASATTSSLTTQSTIEALAASLASTDYTSAARVVVSENTTSSIHLASVYAARKGLPVIVSTSGTTTTGISSSLSGWSTTSVVLVSSTPAYFTTGFQSALTTAGVSTAAYFQSSDVFTRWKDAAYETSATQYVLARTDDALAVTLATTYASNRGLPLVLWESTTAPATLTAFFSSVTTAQLVFFGDPLTTPTPQIDPDSIELILNIPVSDPQEAYVWVASQSQLGGAVSNKVVVASSDSVAEVALAGAHARKTGAVLAPAGAKASLGTSSRAAEYLTLWGAEAGSVELVGVSLTTSNLTTVVAPTTAAADAAPAFRVLNLALGSTGVYTLTFTAVTGATSYVVYGPDTSVVGSSSTTTITFSGAYPGFLLTAETSSGELARLDVRTNEYATTGQRSTAVVGQTSGGTEHLIFLSDLDVPRLITRQTVNVFEEPTEDDAVPVAITCASTFTESGMDAQKQYIYTVTELANVNARACDPLAAVTGSTSAGVNTASIPLPFTEFPDWARGTEPVTAPSPTIMDTLLSGVSQDDLLNGDLASRAEGDGWTPVIVQWVAYIPERRVPFPLISSDLTRPYVYFSGDNHGTFRPNESNRFYQRLEFSWGSAHTISYDADMGVSHKEQCAVFQLLCQVVDTAEASETELHWTALPGSTNTSASARVYAEATLPLLDIAPAISTDWRINLKPGASVVYGYHDKMPQHELYIGSPYSMFYRVYQSPYAGWQQVGCLSSGPTFLIPGCYSLFNIQL